MAPLHDFVLFMRTSSTLSAALALLLISTSLADDKILLRPHYEIGKIYRQENVTDLGMAIPGLGDAGGQKTNITQILSVTVTKDGTTENKLAEVKFTAIKGTVSMMGQNMTFDSADPAKSSPFLQQTFGALVGKSFTLAYDKEDKFLEVRGLDKVAGTPLGQGKSPDNAQLADAFRKTQEMSLPGKPVAVGDTWTYEDSIDMPPLGKILIKATGKFDSIGTKDGHQQAKLLLDGNFATPEGGAAALPVKFGDGSKFSGVMYFDLDRKEVTRSEMNSHLKLIICGKEAPLNQTVVTRLVAIDDVK